MAILKIPVTKAGNRLIEVDPGQLSDEIYAIALVEGLKPLINKGMSKILTKNLDGDELEAAKSAAYAIAEKNLENLYAGKVRKGRVAATTADGKKVPGVVLTEARRLAKEVVKNEIRASGGKISHYEASEITKAANELLAADSSFIETATANIEARTKIKSAVDISTLIHESPKLVAAAEKAKAERKSQLSAKQAGKAAPRKPKGEAHVTH